MNNKRKTKIICTIGPATNSVETIRRLYNSGMNIARINFSHGDHEQHHQIIKNIREASLETEQFIPIMGDLCGPKIRIGNLEKSLDVENDELVDLYYGQPSSDIKGKSLPISYDKLHKDVNVGETVLIDDGLVELKIIDKTESRITCKIIEGGIVRSNKGVNFPDTHLSLPSLTDKDMKDIEFAIEHKLDFLALSFVRDSKDIIDLRNYLATKGYPIPIIAKIEKPQAIRDLDQIIENSDVIMIARGDLGVEMDAYEVPILQKKIIRKCLVFNTPVITATQMLESMISNLRCTRAEASDVANAVFDGTDAVMLSGETSIGLHPVAAVEIMHSILFRAEQTDYLRLNLFEEESMVDNSYLAIDLSKAACRIAKDIKASLIIAMTKTGRTARYLAKYRTKTPIIAFTPNRATIPMLLITWGVECVLLDSFGITDEILSQAKESLLETERIGREEIIVFVTGSPMLETTEINMIKIDKS